MGPSRMTILFFPLLVLACSGRGEYVEPGTDAAVPSDGGAFMPDLGSLSITRVIPSRGGFSGAERVRIRGSGFTGTSIGVRFGSTDVDAAQIRRIDRSTLEVTTPPGAPGTVDVTVTIDDAAATLSDGYTYETVEILPRRGPITGGALLTVRASEDSFDAATAVALDGAACTDVVLVDARQLRCRTPAGARGPADVTVTTAGATLSLADGYTYEDPFERTLGGGPLEGTLRVLVVGGFGVPAPLPDALVVAGRVGEAQHTARTDARGIATLVHDDLRGPIQVFATHPCANGRVGFVGFESSYVRITLRFGFVAAQCGYESGGSAPPMPEGPVEGEIVFYEGQEFPTPVPQWAGVPEPTGGLVRAAYVVLVTQPDTVDPRGGTPVAITRIGYSETGTPGYAFSWPRVRGGGALVPVALAGLEPPAGPGDGRGPEGGDGMDGRSIAVVVPDGFVPHVIGVGSAVVPVPSSVARATIAMTGRVGAGREIRATLPEPLATLGFLTGAYSEPTVETGSFDLLEVTVRYAIPTYGAGISLFPWPLASVAGSPTGALLERQPTLAGAFADATQVLYARVARQGADRYRSAFMESRVETSLSTDPVEMTFLPPPSFEAPTATAPRLPADRTIRWSTGHTGALRQYLVVNPLRDDGLPRPRWAFVAHSSARAVSFPDLRGLGGLTVSTVPGRHSLLVTSSEWTGGPDLEDVDAAGVGARTSGNMTLLEME
jgi:hypothetical protein